MKPEIVEYLELQRRELADRHFDALRLYPLILVRSLEDFLAHCGRTFDSWKPQEKGYGYHAAFESVLRNGERVSGSFDVLTVDEGTLLVVSSLHGRENKYGPERLVGTVYPLALRPLVNVKFLGRTIERFVDSHGARAETTNIMGRHKATTGYALDKERLTIEDAFEQWSDERKDIRRVEFALYDEPGSIVVRVAVDREGVVRVYSGDPGICVESLALSIVQESNSLREQRYALKRADHFLKQQSLDISFDQAVFPDTDRMRELCGKLQEEDGFSVTIRHLNPYLHAQILDFYTGGIIELVILNARTVSLIPVSSRSALLMERSTAIIQDRFGDPSDIAPSSLRA